MQYLLISSDQEEIDMIKKIISEKDLTVSTCFSDGMKNVVFCNQEYNLLILGKNVKFDAGGTKNESATNLIINYIERKNIKLPIFSLKDNLVINKETTKGKHLKRK